MMAVIDDKKSINIEEKPSIILLPTIDITTKIRKDGKMKNTRSNKKKDERAIVFAFDTEEKIKNMLEIFNKHIMKANTETREHSARRNKLAFLIGISIGIRAGDFVKLKWNYLIESLKPDGTIGKFRDYYDLKPEKQKKQNKFVRLYFNQTVKQAIIEYTINFPIKDLDDYVFFSTNISDGHMEYHAFYEMLKKTAKEAGIEENIGTHSLRKTWGFWCWHNAVDKSKALVTLQQCFNHSSVQTTLKYIGLLDVEIKEMYDSMKLGLKYM